MRMVFLVAVVLAGVAAGAERAEEVAERRVDAFESSLFVDRAKHDFKQRPEAEQRPLVAAFFATLTRPEEKLAFLGVGDSRYVYAINRQVYGEYAAKLLTDEDADVRKGAVQGLVYNGLRQYGDGVAKLLDDQRAGVRISAAMALGRFGRHDLLPRMEEMARSANGEEECVAGLQAAGTLFADKGATGEQRERALLVIDRYIDPKATVGMQTAAMVAIVGAPEAGKYIAKIVTLSGSSDPVVRTQAVKTLERVEGPAALEVIRRGLADSERNVRLAAAKAVGSRNVREAAADVAKLLEDEDAAVRIGGIEALAAINAVEYADAIALRLRDKDVYVRRPAVAALAALKSAKHAGEIAGALAANDMSLRVEVLRALIAVGTREQAAAVAGVANDESYAVRVWVVRALDALDAREQRAVVETLAGDKEEENVAGEAKMLLKKWDGK